MSAVIGLVVVAAEHRAAVRNSNSAIICRPHTVQRPQCQKQTKEVVQGNCYGRGAGESRPELVCEASPPRGKPCPVQMLSTLHLVLLSLAVLGAVPYGPACDGGACKAIRRILTITP